MGVEFHHNCPMGRTRGTMGTRERSRTAGKLGRLSIIDVQRTRSVPGRSLVGWAVATSTLAAVLLAVTSCGLVSDERAGGGPAEEPAGRGAGATAEARAADRLALEEGEGATSTTEPQTTTTTEPEPEVTTTTVPSGGGGLPLGTSAVWPQTPEFCEAGSSIFLLGENLASGVFIPDGQVGSKLVDRARFDTLSEALANISAITPPAMASHVDAVVNSRNEVLVQLEGLGPEDEYPEGFADAMMSSWLETKADMEALVAWCGHETVLPPETSGA